MSRVRTLSIYFLIFFLAYSITIQFIWHPTKKTYWSPSWRLRSLKFNKGTKTTWHWGISCMRFRLSSVTCKIRKCCKITTLRPDTTPTASPYKVLRKSVTMVDSTWMTNRELTMTVSLRSLPWESRSRDAKLKSSQGREMSNKSQTMHTP